VHEIGETFQPTEKPQEVTTLLVYKTQDSEGNERVDFMTLTPLLYQWLVALPEFESASKALLAVTETLEIEETALLDFAKQSLKELQQLGIVKSA